MLRGKPENPETAGIASANPRLLSDGTEYPGLEQPYLTGERPPGIRFYRAKESFWVPYHLLQCVEFGADQLKLLFAAEDILIAGRGLHRLYVELARQAVSQVVEQGERFAAISEAATLIARIERIPHATDEQQQQNSSAQR